MSLFNLQDVCIAIGSLATLDLPMVVDLIGIYGLKGPYCTLTTTNWFLQELSVIPRGSWGDVARRFTMIRWTDSRFPHGYSAQCVEHEKRISGSESQQGSNRGFPLLRGKTTLSKNAASLSRISRRRRRLPRAAAAATAADRRRKLVSGQFDEENPFVLISSGLLVQPDKGVSDLVVDRIGIGKRKSGCRPPGRRRARRCLPLARMNARRARWPRNAGLVQRDRCAIVGRRMAPLRERRLAAGCRYAHWLREIEGSAWRAMMSDVGRPLRAGVAPPRAPLLAGDGAHSLRVLHAARCARCRLVFVGVAPPSSAAAPASFRRCRDGWSEFF
ncbi:acyl-CoA dehydrogenase-related protein [Dorcoceras hygrometricum]|uniref:Acyl-CoA dehydrogenase-related protein n=1 Tax=Dorcoceras hygrometricum TaxID=472368 RepID=A0A2Z6ZXB7_9LAMI|nr:acyl-CoA dehydrogenase-related protein [Dorcoceras hygrometricum]